MKSTAFAIACTLIFAAPAAAELRLSTSGKGDAIYIPHYSVEDGRDSLLTVANDSDQPSMVRVLFAEADNGQSVLNFNVYLPPRSVWSAALASAEGGGARLSSMSGICTVPSSIGGGANLVPFDYAANFPDGGDTGIDRTRQGAVEVIELGALTGGLGDNTTARNCAAIEEAYVVVDGVPPDRTGQILPPTSQISAGVQLVDVAEGQVFGVPGVAVQGFANTPQDPDFDGYVPRFANPLLAAGQTEYTTETAHGELQFAADRGPDAMSSLFMQSELGGEFYADPGLGASTRWVVSMPTKAAYVSERPGSLAADGQPVAPFSSFFGPNGACDQVLVRQGSLDGTPLETLVPVTLNLCEQVNLIDFDQPFAPSGTTVLQLMAQEIRSIQAQRPDGTPVTLNGLPVTGVQISNFVNGQLAEGVLANYSISQPLRGAAATLSE
jgi:hypothetical protein